MHYIAHRINSLEELRALPREYGVELDIRDFGDGLVLSHDPFVDGEPLEPYLAEYQHGTLILNIKSERVEHRVLELLQKYQLQDYFFLDSSFPMIYLLSKQGEKRMALRFSQFEGMDTLKAMQGKVDWVWVDCFTELPLTQALYQEIKALGYKLCLVSPELQGRAEDLEKYRDYLRSEGIVFNAICTKHYNIERWQATVG